jgi:hypothetical protein
MAPARLVLDPLQRAFRTLRGGPDGPIAIRGQRRPTASLTSFMAMDSPGVVTNMMLRKALLGTKLVVPATLGPSKECSLSHARS